MVEHVRVATTKCVRVPMDSRDPDASMVSNQYVHHLIFMETKNSFSQNCVNVVQMCHLFPFPIAWELRSPCTFVESVERASAKIAVKLQFFAFLSFCVQWYLIFVFIICEILLWYYLYLFHSSFTCAFSWQYNASLCLILLVTASKLFLIVVDNAFLCFLPKLLQAA